MPRRLHSASHWYLAPYLAFYHLADSHLALYPRTVCYRNSVIKLAEFYNYKKTVIAPKSVSSNIYKTYDNTVRCIWSICAFDQMRCACGKCAFDQSPNHDSNPNTNPNPNANPNRNPIPNPNPTLNLASTKCSACMQVGLVRTFDQTRCAFVKCAICQMCPTIQQQTHWISTWHHLIIASSPDLKYAIQCIFNLPVLSSAEKYWSVKWLGTKLFTELLSGVDDRWAHGAAVRFRDHCTYRTYESALFNNSSMLSRMSAIPEEAEY